MKLNRRRLRRLINEEYNKVLREMSEGSMSPDHPDYDTVGECISQVSRAIMYGQLTSVPAIEEACREVCMQYGVPQHTNYCISKALNIAQRMGMIL